ncbi:MAG: gamma-glutamyltransferase [Byssovorax sp.]
MPRPSPSLARTLLAALPALALGAAGLSCSTPAPPAQPPSDPASLASAPATSAPPLASASSSAVTSASASAPAALYPAPAPPDPPIVLHAGGKNAVPGNAGVCATVETNATSICAEVLKKGGNAVDAAVAVAYALAVTHPSAGNIGGGGFMLIRKASGETAAVDFRETAPASATAEKNKAMLDAGAIGYPSAGVPGTVAGMSLALQKFGTRPLAELIAPAIALAKKGHKLGVRQGLVLGWNWEKLKKDPAARAVWGHGKDPWKQGDRVKQTDLAKTLETIAKEGPSGFYGGWVAAAIDKAMGAHGGLITAADLGAYQAKLRAPLRFSYRGFDVLTMPPPSMGGVAFAQIMLTLERWRAYEAPADAGLSLHLFVEAARRAYAERRLVGADPDFMKPDFEAKLLALLLGGEHLETRKPALDRDHATTSADLALAEAELQKSIGDGAAPGAAAAAESPQTTHFSIVDAEGNAVSCTYTQSAAFGSKIIIPGTGVLLGNAMGGFSETGVNGIAPGKRMASSMTPTIVTQNGKLVLVLGSPGGDTIPNTVAQVFRNLVDYGMTVDEAVAHGRIHHQYQPDKVRVEKLLPPPKAALAELGQRGHMVDLDTMPIGHANEILVDPATGWAYGVADRREGGVALGVARPGTKPPIIR